MTPSMRIALADLDLDRIDVIYPGTEVFMLSEQIRVVPVSRVFDLVALRRAR